MLKNRSAYRFTTIIAVTVVAAFAVAANWGVGPGQFASAESANSAMPESAGTATPTPSAGATDQGSETEPNNTAGTADILMGDGGRIKGNLWNEVFATDGTDTDFYSFTTTAPNSRIYAATQTSVSASGTGTTLDVIASDGATVLETDLNDGSLGASSSSISGTLLATPGTYYLRVTNVSPSSPIAPYDLYFTVKSGSPTAEVEPNGSSTPNPLPASGRVSGVIDPAADNDAFSFTANAGDTVYLSLDIDPERDNVQWNGRFGLGVFGTPGNILVVDDTNVGSAANPLSEAFFMTVQSAGTYFVYVDEPAGSGGPTLTYNVVATVIPQPTLSCTTFTNSTATPIADAGLTSSTINIPGSPMIKRARVFTNISHTLTADLDLHLVSPAGNDNGLFTDITTGAGQTVQINNGFADNAGIPIGIFNINSGMIYQPELAFRLGWFNGENGGGEWRLDIRDDLATNTGTLNSWSLELCTEPAPTGTVLYNENFETNNGGYTHTGTFDEWEYGTPATLATTTVPPVAAFSNCASGTNCWKTDLDNTYNLSSSQDLTSPTIDLTTATAPINLNWQARYQMENVTFDRIWVRVTEVGNPTNTRIVWHNNNPTMVDVVGLPAVNIGASAGWGLYTSDISDFAGENVQLTFHLDSDNSQNYGGWAIDDVSVRRAGATPTLGNYPAATVDLSDNITITPDAVPTGATSINVSTSTSFNAELTADVVTGVVRLTNAQPAKLPPGAYTVTVRALGPGGSTTKTFMLTVTTPPACAAITFAAASNFTAGTTPFSVAVGDFNGDGVQDLAVANFGSNNVSVLTGTGTGSFGPASNFTVGATPQSVAVGDFNGDGVQDLAVANANSANVSILTGTGTGSFGAASNFTVGTTPFSVAVGDFNGDGKQDLAVANANSNNVSILTGTGTGSFGPASNFTVGTTPFSVAVGDFNGDGVQDLAVANADSNNVSILTGTGTGSFGPASNFTVGTTPFSVAVGDLNGDGVQDLAVANFGSNNVSVLTGTGTGSFGPASNFTVGASPWSVAVGDLNGDGVQDLAAANLNSNNVSVLTGTGTGSFGPASNFTVGAIPGRSRWAISTATENRIWPPLITHQATYRSSSAPAPRLRRLPRRRHRHLHRRIRQRQRQQQRRQQHRRAHRQFN